MHQSKDAESKDAERRGEEICFLTNQPSSYSEQQGMAKDGAFVARMIFFMPYRYTGDGPPLPVWTRFIRFIIQVRSVTLKP